MERETKHQLIEEIELPCMEVVWQSPGAWWKPMVAAFEAESEEGKGSTFTVVLPTKEVV